MLNHVLLHQTVVGQEAILQMELAGEEPDVIVGCVGGGSNFAGLCFPFLRAGSDARLLAAEPAACPTLTRGVYRYDFGDTSGLTPLMPMYTLGHDFVPAPVHAGGLRYHGDAPMLCGLVKAGRIEARAYRQNETFEAAVRFARTEGIIPAPEPAHAIRAVMDEVERGEAEVILFGLCGHGHFDLAAYDAFLAGTLEDPGVLRRRHGGRPRAAAGGARDRLAGRSRRGRRVSAAAAAVSRERSRVLAEPCPDRSSSPSPPRSSSPPLPPPRRPRRAPARSAAPATRPRSSGSRSPSPASRRGACTRSPPGKPKGLVAFFHGYTHTAQSWAEHIRRTAAQEGVIALAMNYRGQIDGPPYPGTTLPRSRGWQVSEGAADSIAAAKLFDRACPRLPSIVAYGVSMGGNASGLAVASRAKRTTGAPLFDQWFDIEGAVNVIEIYTAARVLAGDRQRARRAGHRGHRA